MENCVLWTSVSYCSIFSGLRLQFYFKLHTPTFPFPPSPPPQVDRVVFCVFLDKDCRIYSKLMPKYFPTAAPPPPLPPSKSRREEKGEGREGARQMGSGGSSPSEEMDQSEMPWQKAGGPSGNEERGHSEKESTSTEEEVQETPADQPGELMCSDV